ncbi:MAG: NYN domain-containing protein [Bacteroidetes bacterium]|nr:NYN domain-containing protein [Bacteroidota bacterium]HET6243368.1 NYN domain-containing protein [Bacteroidia bacterium]
MNELKIALLIDGDNAQPNLLKDILTETGRYGKVTIRRIYGDWTSPSMNGWKTQLNSFAIRPMQKFSYSKGKNSTDSAMIIDAMDILHGKLVNAFCLISSDSDYTGLANRIREEGVFVMGIGQAKTPDAFVKACELFIFTENLTPDETVAAIKKKINSRKNISLTIPENINEQHGLDNFEKINTDINLESEKNSIKSKITKQPLEIRMINSAFDMVKQDDESAYLGAIGEALRRLDSSFDPRTFGFNSLTSLFKSLSEKYELEYRNNGTSVYIKQKY